MLLLNSWQVKYMEKRLRDAKDVGMKKKQTNEYEYCLEVDPVRKANYCFWVSFCKSRCFLQILIPITETDLYKNCERLFEDLAWMQKLHEVFVEQYTRNMYNNIWKWRLCI